MKKFMFILAVICLFTTSFSALAMIDNNDGNVDYSQYKWEVDESIAQYMNVRFDYDRDMIEAYLVMIDEQNRVKEDLNGDSMSVNAILRSTDGAWPFYDTDSKDINCYGYASQFNIYLNPGDIALYYGGYGTHGMDLFKIDILATCVEQDLERSNRSVRTVSGPNATLNSNEYLMVARTGDYDFNGDGRITPGEADYHFMVKNSDGGWSHKPGATPSEYLGDIDPSTYNWKLGPVDNFYDSTPKYFAVEPK